MEQKGLFTKLDFGECQELCIFQSSEMENVLGHVFSCNLLAEHSMGGHTAENMKICQSREDTPKCTFWLKSIPEDVVPNLEIELGSFFWKLLTLVSTPTGGEHSSP